MVKREIIISILFISLLIPFSSAFNFENYNLLSDLDDVRIINPLNMQLLIYNGTSGFWYNDWANESGINVNNSQFLRGLTPQEVSDLYQELWQENGNDIYYNSGNVGVNVTSPIKTFHVNGSALFEPGELFYGYPELNNSFLQNLTNGVIQYWRFENGQYSLKAEIGSSITTDRIILDGVRPQIFARINVSIENDSSINLANLIRESSFSLGAEVGNWFDDTLINTKDVVYLQIDITGIFTTLIQPLENVTHTVTTISYNTTTPTELLNLTIDGGTNYAQDYMLEENYTGRIYTRIFDYEQGLIDPIWESSDFFEFTQGIGGDLILYENTTVYRDYFDTEASLLSNKTYLVETIFSEPVEMKGTNISGEFVPWLRSTGSAFKRREVATYEFNSNNFNGSGNFTTTGNITLGEKLVFKFGEMIDNIIPGWLRVTGNLNVTGNIEGSRYYGEIYVTDSIIPTVINSVGVWENLTHLECGLNNSVTCYGSNLTIQNNGVYRFDYSSSFEDGANSVAEVTIGINGQPKHKCESERKLGTAGDVGNSGGTCLLDLESGDIITLMVRNNFNSNNFLFSDVNLNGVNIGH